MRVVQDPCLPRGIHDTEKPSANYTESSHSSVHKLYEQFPSPPPLGGAAWFRYICFADMLEQLPLQSPAFQSVQLSPTGSRRTRTSRQP